ncbi:HAD family hydrolase [Occallatibacter savannae]|uniref:HAD family hydrolase n=1 Tax=Occallatibacter savannae TaxID=1002691 RepID=UPI000D69D54F|nr:HAD family hydrolase [Occallatibacter savannae]
MIEALLSDIDGTLVDSNALHAEAWRRTFEHFGIQVGMDEAWRQIGKGGDKLIPVFVREADRKRLQKDLEAFRKEIFHRDYMPRIVSFPRSKDLFRAVKQNGTKIVLATSSDKEDVSTYKRIIGIEDLVDEESSASDVEESKPDPGIFAVALKKIGVAADRAIALGDTPYDAQAAGKLGIKVIGLTCGGWKRNDLFDAGCAEVYQDPADLLVHLRESPLAK